MSGLFKFFQIFILIFFCFNLGITGQSESIEQLRREIDHTVADSLLINLYDKISLKLSTINPGEGLEYAEKQLILAKKMNDHNLIPSAYLNLAINYINVEKADSSIYYARKALQFNQTKKYDFAVFTTIGNAFQSCLELDSATYYYLKALRLAEKKNDTIDIATSYNNLGLIYMDLGKLQVSFENFLNAFEYFEKANDKPNQAIALNNLGLVNIETGNTEMAISYFNQAVALNQEIEDNMNLSMNYSNLGVLYKGMEDYERALEYYSKSLAISENFGFTNDLARHYHNVGNVYLKTGKIEKAKESYLRSLKISQRQGMEIGELYNNFQLSRLEIRQGLFDSVEIRLRKVDELLHKSGMARLRIDYYELMSELEEERGNFGNALQFYKKLKTYADSMQDIAQQIQIEDIQTKYVTEKKSLENEKLKDQDLLNKKIIQNQQLIVLFILVTLLFSVLLSINFFRSRQKLRRAFDSLKKLNREVIKQKEELEESNQTKDKMFSIIAHDLRSPFNSLIGFLDVLISDFDSMEDKEKKEMLWVLNNESVKTYGLLENLLQWSMMQRGMIELNPGHYNLYRIIQSQIADLSSRALGKQITIVNKIEPGIQLFIDENICRTIFRNLINNAIKFSGRGGNIFIESTVEHSCTTVRVIDDGVGMTAAFAAGLFTGNIPQSTRGTENETGSGLGLRIVRDFIELLNAEIKVETQPGKGSTFYLTFKNTKED